MSRQPLPAIHAVGDPIINIFIFDKPALSLHNLRGDNACYPYSSLALLTMVN